MNRLVSGCQALGMGSGVGKSGAICSMWDPCGDEPMLYLGCGVET